ncbi:MAG TPA: VTT domain-containing protein [Methylomirabilota bacterium]|nr:VTT domain-containing protein [Methylomirabilota bacterium]
MSEILGLLVRYGYVVVFGVILLENLGLPLPGIAVLVLAGALAAAGSLSLALIVLLAIGGAVLGDLVWYALGRWRGRPVLGFLCRLSLNSDTCVGQSERFFLRYGMPSLLVAKFVPGFNTVAPPLMGTLRARFGAFLAFDTGGALLFAVVAAGGGYLLGAEMVERTHVAVAAMGAWLGWAATALLAGYVGWRLLIRLRVRYALRTVGLTAAELHQRLAEGVAVTVIDVRSPLAVAEKPRAIPGALHATQETLAALVAEWPRDRQIVTYCV